MVDEHLTIGENTFRRLRNTFFIAIGGMALAIFLSYNILQNYLDLQKPDTMVRAIQRYSLIAMGIIFAILALVYLFLLLPMAKMVRKRINERVRSEERAMELAEETDRLNLQKEQSMRELNALSNVLNQSLLYARIRSNGQVLFLGEKFKKLFIIKTFQEKRNFEEILSHRNSEQERIRKILADYCKTGWQGEVKCSTIDNRDIWLEMTFLPFINIREKTELAVICRDITTRIESQKEIERLIQQSFDAKITRQQEMAQMIIENQEKEQNRIAKELHDGIGQKLTALKFNLESIDLEQRERSQTKLNHLKDITHDIIRGIRSATANLTPPELMDHGLVSALEKFIDEISKLTDQKIKFINKSGFSERLNVIAEINIYRMVQEAVNNAIKYADAAIVIVQVSHANDLLSILIDDNGIGFEWSEVEKGMNNGGGLGIGNMQERIKYIHGRIFINSQINHGTRVTINVPLSKNT